MSVSNTITAVLNFIAILCSIPIIAAGIWLSSKPDSECVRLVRWPLVILGVLVLLVALAGFVGAYWNREGLLAAYLFCMAALIAALIVLLVFAFVVTRPDGSYPLAGAGFLEYRVAGFAPWLRNYVADPGNWDRIRRCLSASDICGRIVREEGGYITADQFFRSDLSPIQSGCCKPPMSCGYNYVNPTFWINPSNPGSDPDCYIWSNDQSQLCYSCSSCKAGLLGNLCHEWRKANVALIVATVALIWVYIIGCSAFKNAQTEDIFRRFKRGYT